MDHIGRVKIINRTENELESVCICPRCGKKEIYGNLIWYSGFECCPFCHEDLRREIEEDKEKRYELYLAKAKNRSYNPFGYTGEGETE